MRWRPTRPPGEAERRLQHVIGGSVSARDPAPSVRAPRPERARVLLGPWRGPALRGLALLVVAVVLVVGYQAWTGRPRAVAEVPVPMGSPWSSAVPATPIPTPETDTGPVASPTLGASPAAAAGAGRAADGNAALVVGQVPAASAESSPSPTVPLAVVVHVVGLVAHPGLVALPAGSRVADAIEAAGGVTKPRAADTVNLARLLVDGEQVAVGRPALPGNPASTPAGGPAGSSGGAPLLVDLNSASADLLDSLPGIGPVIAARIVTWRTANGPFRSIDELGEVSGIGDAILGQIRDLVRI